MTGKNEDTLIIRHWENKWELFWNFGNPLLISTGSVPRYLSGMGQNFKETGTSGTIISGDKNQGKKVSCWMQRLLLLCCRLLYGLLCFRLLCRCLLCCCHVGIHLLPERVIFSLNLSINKYFGRNVILRPRNAHNHYFLHCKWLLSKQERIIKVLHHEMRNPSDIPRI